ncbi:hypothetical protein NQ315_011612 [Exocentrus adspersus]|uniref:aralkylamine N-acetyltransferase n=1 Tax=Exocentrus adspersus TaxID=1586481 RepID=A0AAV8VW56_9CUCU|nr:hypothetical protein NQ315_011612 [Exocentrus adspersus]
MTLNFGRLMNKIFSKANHGSSVHTKQLSIFKKSKTKEQISPYIILRATKDDHLNILRLMQETYFVEEPTHYSLGVTKNQVLNERALSALAENMTVISRCKYDGRIVGACINVSAHCWDPDVQEKLACGVRCPKVRQLLLFLAHMQRFPDIWRKYDVNKVFEMDMMFVHRHHRKRGIAMRLMKESLDTAADCGFKVVRCDASNAYTAKLCERLHMEKIAEIPYSSYLSRNMEQIFSPPHPHQSVKIYVDIDPQLKKFNK